ncbi:M48 family metallopeptidase [Myxococcota bacterium]|jgi:predicted Zn-dependent protease|nr:M48 family metallopeptidase [Myxococcota bacterium]
MRSPLLSKVLALALIASTVGTAAAKVPVTGRRQFNLIPDALMRQLGESSYKSTLADVKLSTGNENSQAIKSVGQAIAKAANQKSYDWEFKLIQENDTINAWCMPGGKIAVYTGLLPVVQNEAGLAFVMGHEVGHATAHHGAERLSQQLAVLGGMGALYLYLDNKSEMSTEQKAIVVAAMGAGAQVGVILPFSRLHEKEADVIGMMYMAKAGYPPSESIDVWDRMAKASGGGGTPAFLSTHPSEDKRQENLKDWMPQAKKRYERNKLSRNTQTTQWTSSDFGGSSGGGGGRKNNDSSSSGSGGASSGGTRR